MFGNIRKVGCIADGDVYCVEHCPADDTGDVGSGAAACIEHHSALYDHYSNWGSCPAPSCEVCGDEIDIEVDHEDDCECPVSNSCGRRGCFHRPNFDCYGAERCDECALFLDPAANFPPLTFYRERPIPIVCGGHVASGEWPQAEAEALTLPLTPVRAYAGPVGVGFDTLAEAYSRKGPL